VSDEYDREEGGINSGNERDLWSMIGFVAMCSGPNTNIGWTE